MDLRTSPEISLWLIFSEYWDDEAVVGGRQPVVMSARMVRVLARVFGHEFVSESLSKWENEGSIKILGVATELPAEAPCVELHDYVSNTL